MMQLFFILFFLPLSLFSLTLKEEFQKAKVGDFIIMEHGRQMTMLLVSEKEGSKLFLEEITIAENHVYNRFSWKDWLKQKAPRHTSWVIYEIDLKSGKVISMYSISQHDYIRTNPFNNFLSTLLNIPFYEVSSKERKRIGKTPSQGEDTRPFWQPRLIFEGRPIAATFTVWRTKWPPDGTDLSGSSVEIYLPDEDIEAPSYFPYWMQIQDQSGKSILRVVDSGVLNN